MNRRRWSGFTASLALPLLAWGCGGGGPKPAPVKDVQFTQAMSSARLAYDRGQTPQAVLLFDQALRRAEARDDAADIGEAAYNLSIALADDGQLDPAAEMAALALRELERAGQRTIDVKLVQAKLAHRRGKSAVTDAEALANEVAQAKDAFPSERSQAAILLGEIALERGDRDAAAARLLDARRALNDLGKAARGSRASSPGGATQSALLGLEGRLALANGNSAEAATKFDAQSAQAQAAAMYGEMATALAAAGEAHLKAGNTAAAADRLYRAARSLLAQGEREQGAAVARQAEEAARSAGDAKLVDLVQSLLEAPQTNPIQ